MAKFSKEHKQGAAQLLVTAAALERGVQGLRGGGGPTAATLERGYQAFRGGGDLRVFQTQVNELGREHRQWLSDLDSFKNSLRTQGTEPKALEYVNEAFGRLAERIKQLAG